jgi:hypothetical protein
VSAETWEQLERPEPFIFSDGELSVMGRQPFGNLEHVAPEVLNAFTSHSKNRDTAGLIDYTKQAVFDAGVLLAELLLGTHPIDGYPAAFAPPAGSPAADATPAVRAYWPEELQVLAHHDLYPDDFLALVRRMLAFDPAARPSVGEVLGAVAVARGLCSEWVLFGLVEWAWGRDACLEEAVEVGAVRLFTYCTVRLPMPAQGIAVRNRTKLSLCGRRLRVRGVDRSIGVL